MENWLVNAGIAVFPSGLLWIALRIFVPRRAVWIPTLLGHLLCLGALCVLIFTSRDPNSGLAFIPFMMSMPVVFCAALAVQHWTNARPTARATDVGTVSFVLAVVAQAAGFIAAFVLA